MFLALTVLAGLSSAAWGQRTYWLPAKQSTPTEKIYTYGTRLPDGFAAALARRGQTVTHEVDGKPHELLKVSVDWDSNGGANPAGQGQVSIHEGKGWGQEWLPGDPALSGDASVIKALDAAVTSEHGSWRVADLLLLIADGDTNPNLTLRFPIPEVDQIKARMRSIAETTAPGQFFPGEVQIPQDLDAMRREILAVGNIGRRDPNFRKRNQYANDLSGDMATSMGGSPQKIYKNNPSPPYFNDLVLHPKLNEAAQYMAEYYAKTNGNAGIRDILRKHDAPGAVWKGAKMDKFGDRLDHFAPGVGSAGEGLAGPGAADIAPETWMHTETHYRPWFNIDHDVKSMGLGAARTDKGWFFCKIGGTELPEGVTQPAGPVTQPGAVDPLVAALREGMTQPSPNDSPGIVTVGEGQIAGLDPPPSKQTVLQLVGKTWAGEWSWGDDDGKGLSKITLEGEGKVRYAHAGGNGSALFEGPMAHGGNNASQPIVFNLTLDDGKDVRLEWLADDLIKGEIWHKGKKAGVKQNNPAQGTAIFTLTSD